MQTKTQRKTSFAVNILTIILALSCFTFQLGYRAAARPGAGTEEAIWEPGTQVSEASYVIWTELYDQGYYAKNGTTGAVDFSGTNFTQIFENCRDNLMFGSLGKGHIHLKSGYFYQKGALVFNKDSIKLTGDGPYSTYIVNNADYDGLDDTPSILLPGTGTTNDIEIANLQIQIAGNIDIGTRGALEIQGIATRNYFHNLIIWDGTAGGTGTGILIDASNNNYIDNQHFLNIFTYGFSDSIHIKTGTSGAGYANELRFIDLNIQRPTDSAIEVSGPKASSTGAGFGNNHFVSCTLHAGAITQVFINFSDPDLLSRHNHFISCVAQDLPGSGRFAKLSQNSTGTDIIGCKPIMLTDGTLLIDGLPVNSTLIWAAGYSPYLSSTFIPRCQTPDTTGWGYERQGLIWFNNQIGHFEGWNGTHVVTLDA